MFLPQTSLQATQKSKGSLLPKIRSDFFEEQCALSAESLTTGAEWTSESFLLSSFFSSSSCFSTEVRWESETSGRCLLDHCCSCSILSAFGLWHQVVISLLPPAPCPEVAVFRRDLPPLHGSLCLWNVQRSAPRRLHKETCYGDSQLTSALSHVPVISHHVTELKGVEGV